MEKTAVLVKLFLPFRHKVKMLPKAIILTKTGQNKSKGPIVSTASEVFLSFTTQINVQLRHLYVL